VLSSVSMSSDLQVILPKLEQMEAETTVVRRMNE
jgi:hypothetical protein